jgi:hypothetical protein
MPPPEICPCKQALPAPPARPRRARRPTRLVEASRRRRRRRRCFCCHRNHHRPNALISYPSLPGRAGLACQGARARYRRRAGPGQRKRAGPARRPQARRLSPRTAGRPPRSVPGPAGGVARAGPRVPGPAGPAWWALVAAAAGTCSPLRQFQAVRVCPTHGGRRTDGEGPPRAGCRCRPLAPTRSAATVTCSHHDHRDLQPP